MRQKGFILLIPLIVVAIAIVIGVIFIQQTKSTSINGYLSNLFNFSTTEPTTEPNQNEPATTTTPTPTSLVQTPTPTPNKTATPQPIKTKTPTPTPVKTAIPVSKSTCGINISSDSQNPLGVRLTYSANSSNGSYMSGAQWDFDGNGSWDTDMSQANGTTTHVYSNNGTYTVKLQLKMSDGTTTNICSKSVTVPSGFNVKMTGRVYEDVNCNDMQEPDEKGISGVTVSFYLMPSWTHYADVTSDSNGYYELSRNLSPGDSLTIQPANVAPAGYKIHDDGHTITLNAAQPSINMDLPQVPASSVGQCQ